MLKSKFDPFYTLLGKSVPPKCIFFDILDTFEQKSENRQKSKNGPFRPILVTFGHFYENLKLPNAFF